MITAYKLFSFLLPGQLLRQTACLTYLGQCTEIQYIKFITMQGRINSLQQPDPFTHKHKRQNYQRFLPIDQVRNAKRQLLEKMITQDNSDTYIGHILRKNQDSLHRRRLKTLSEISHYQTQSKRNVFEDESKNQFLGERYQIMDSSNSSSAHPMRSHLYPSFSNSKKSGSQFFHSHQHSSHHSSSSKINTQSIPEDEQHSVIAEKGVKKLAQTGSQLQTVFFQIDDSPVRRKKNQLLKLFNTIDKTGILSKMDSNLLLCLMKIGKYHALFPGQLVYKQGHKRQAIFFILEGAVSLTNEAIQFIKLLFTGETFGQQMLFGDQPAREFLEEAKVITRAFILEITVKDYLTIKKQMKKYGNLKAVEVLEEELRDSFTAKNLNRNDSLIKKEQVQT